MKFLIGVKYLPPLYIYIYIYYCLTLFHMRLTFFLTLFMFSTDAVLFDHSFLGCLS